MARNFTLRFVNSDLIFATVPNSVVHTGVQSAGCEKSTPQLSPSHLWKSTSPSVVCAVKLGAVSPNLKAIFLSVFLIREANCYSALPPKAMIIFTLGGHHFSRREYPVSRATR